MPNSTQHHLLLVDIFFYKNLYFVVPTKRCVDVDCIVPVH
jgi:hypothetical protein